MNIINDIGFQCNYVAPLIDECGSREKALETATAILKALPNKDGKIAKIWKNMVEALRYDALPLRSLTAIPTDEALLVWALANGLVKPLMYWRGEPVTGDWDDQYELWSVIEGDGLDAVAHYCGSAKKNSYGMRRPPVMTHEARRVLHKLYGV